MMITSLIEIANDLGLTVKCYLGLAEQQLKTQLPFTQMKLRYHSTVHFPYTDNIRISVT